VARAAAVAGCRGTSNLAASMRYGLQPVGTMAHSYVMSFPSEAEAFHAFMEDFPDNAVLLVDTYDTLDGVQNAIAAAQETGVPLAGVRLDSGDLDELSRAARGLLEEAGMADTKIVASGDLEERRIAELVAGGAPIDVWGVGTDLGTSRDSPVVNGVYKLVADRPGAGDWRGVMKRSADKATVPGAKQVFRRIEAGVMAGDVIAAAEEELEGEPLLAPAMRAGESVDAESLDEIRARSAAQLASLPERLRTAGGEIEPEPYPVLYSERLRAASS
jgi:nicotinate phosphoribosyltransferase